MKYKKLPRGANPAQVSDGTMPSVLRSSAVHTVYQITLVLQEHQVNLRGWPPLHWNASPDIKESHKERCFSIHCGQCARESPQVLFPTCISSPAACLLYFFLLLPPSISRYFPSVTANRWLLVLGKALFCLWDIEPAYEQKSSKASGRFGRLNSRVIIFWKINSGHLCILSIYDR